MNKNFAHTAARLACLIGAALLSFSAAAASHPSHRAVPSPTPAPSSESTTEVPKKLTINDLSDHDLQIYEKGEIGGGELVGGGLLGTIVGFGTGHIVYGYYGRKGYIFTLGEVGSLLAFTVGAAGLVTHCTLGDANGCGNSVLLIFAGELGFVFFKVWEIIDVWTLPGGHNRSYRRIKARLNGDDEAGPDYFVMPLVAGFQNGSNTPGYGLQLGFRF